MITTLAIFLIEAALCLQVFMIYETKEWVNDPILFFDTPTLLLFFLGFMYAVFLQIIGAYMLIELYY